MLAITQMTEADLLALMKADRLELSRRQAKQTAIDSEVIEAAKDDVHGPLQARARQAH